MKIGKIIISILLVGIFVGLGFITGTRYKDTGKMKSNLPIVVKTVDPTQAQEIKERVVSYVMKTNTQISKRTATDIVNEAYKQPSPLVLLAIIKVESGYAPWALSKKNAKGLGQVMWFVHGKELIQAGILKEERDLFDIDTNLKACSFVWQQKLKTYNGDALKALDGYLGVRDNNYRQLVTASLFELIILTGDKKWLL